MKKYSLLILLLFIVLARITGQEHIDLGRPLIDTYQMVDLGFHFQSWDIVQDKNGIMYIGNGAGILIFDGTNWSNLPITNTTPPRALAFNDDGILFAGAINDLGYVDFYEKPQPEFISLVDKLPEDERDFGDIWSIVPSGDRIFFITSRGVMVYENGEFTIIKTMGNSLNGYDLAGTFIIQTEESLSYYDDGQFLPLPQTEGLGVIDYSPHTAFLPYDNDQILIVTSKSKFFLYSPGFFYDEKIGSYDFGKTDLSPSLIKEFSTSAAEYVSFERNGFSKGRVYGDEGYILATRSGGVIVMDKKGDILHIINENRGIPGDYIYGIHGDKNKNVWASHNEGISKIILNSPVTVFDQAAGIDDVVFSVIRHKGILYVGTFSNLFYLPPYRMSMEKDGHSFKLIGEFPTGIWDFYIFRDTLLIPTGTAIFAADEGNIEPIFQLQFLDNFMTLGETPRFKDLLFLGLTDNLGLARIIPADNKYGFTLEFVGVYKKLKEHSIRVIIPDDNGDLWITTVANGIYHLKFTGTEFHEYELINYSVKDGLPAANWNMVHLFQGRIVAATVDGVYSLSDEINPETGKKEFVPDPFFAEIVPENSGIFSIYEDRGGQIWLSTRDKTLIRLEKHPDGFYTIIDQGSGVIPVDGEVFEDEHGLFWFYDHNRVIRYDKNITREHSGGYKTIIRKVSIPSDEEYIDSLYHDFNSKIDVFSFEDNRIAIEFSAIWYDNSDKLRYSYFLKGLDQEWSSWKEGDKAVYTNLFEGEYQFLVRAINEQGVESTTASYRFIIHPPWYRTPLAYIIYFMLGIGGLYLLVWLNARRLIRAKQNLETLVARRTMEIKAQNREIQRQKEKIEQQAEVLKEKNIELQELSIVAEETDNAVMIMNAEGDVEWVNKSFKRMYRDSFDKKRNIIDIRNRNEIRRALARCWKDKKAIVFDTSITSDDGYTMGIQTTLTPLLDEKDMIVKIIAIDSNITELKQAQRKALLNAHKAGMVDVAASTLHNIGNILNSVKTSADSIRLLFDKSVYAKVLRANSLLRQNMGRLKEFISEDPKGEKLMEYYLSLEDEIINEQEAIKNRVERVRANVNSISEVLSTHRSYVNKKDFITEEIDLAKIVEDTIMMDYNAIMLEQIKIHMDFEPAPAVPAQKIKVIQIVMNLISNAKDAMKVMGEKDKFLGFSIQRKQKCVELRVTDSGHGIEEKNLVNIFNYGFSTKRSGRGFGLHNCANFMKEMGGSIRAESKGSGKGAVFILIFPINGADDEESGGE